MAEIYLVDGGTTLRESIKAGVLQPGDRLKVETVAPDVVCYEVERD